MRQERSPRALLSESSESHVFVLAKDKDIEGNGAEHWSTLLDAARDKLLDPHERADDRAYGIYLDLLFPSVHRRFRITPPGRVSSVPYGEKPTHGTTKVPLVRRSRRV